ncbi:DUF378 domain-containing protein [Filibacter tadaridae]|uniref:DUF378 domain-containing protein n=1 Tax=Filibacter tadaridae TaxID=2483811 RepID=A0A3P5XB33_9BACL|nr:DUF378 domain-containing protein [Filibacter tadaridae]VDC31876.1 hypothetical protein FILTAD_02490 [Filibacter tadaridae]
MVILRKLAVALLIIGALNWGLVGLFRFDVVGQMAGGTSEPLARLFYILVGLSGLLNLGLLFKREDRDDVNVPTAEKA